MKKEDSSKPKIIQPSEILLNLTQKSKITKRKQIRKEFLEQQKEKYKNKSDKQSLKQYKKKIVSELKEVHADAS